MERDPFNIKITWLDIVKSAGGLACELFRMHLLSPVSEHFQTPNTGAAVALDEALYDQPEFDFEAQAEVGW